MIPVITFVERLPELTLKGEHRTKTHRHLLCACDVCGEETYVASTRLGVKCRMTPRCGGHHRRPVPMEKSA